MIRKYFFAAPLLLAIGSLAYAAVSAECLAQTPPSKILKGELEGNAIWGSPSTGYTTDSQLSVAAVHAGLCEQRREYATKSPV